MTSPCGLTLRKEAAFASHTSRNFSIYSRKRVKARAFGLVLMHELHVIMILLVSSINNINYHVLFFLKCLVFVFNSWELKVSEFTPNVRQKRLKRFLSEQIFGCFWTLKLLSRSRFTLLWITDHGWVTLRVFTPWVTHERKWKQKLLLVLFLIVVINSLCCRALLHFPGCPLGSWQSRSCELLSEWGIEVDQQH